MSNVVTHDPEPAAGSELEGRAPGCRVFSFVGRLAGVLVLALALFAISTLAGLRLTPLAPWLVHLLVFVVLMPAAVWATGRCLRPLTQTLDSLSDGIRAFSDRDFSLRISSRRSGEMGDLVRLYNRVGETLQEERGQIRQRELLLQTALDQSPIAIVLVNPLERVIYANQEARRLFLRGGRLGGRHFAEILRGCPEPLRDLLDAEADGIFTVDSGAVAETYHLARRGFHLNRRRHTLYLLRRMTDELGRQEAEIWKKVIRVISHELNNSLAPISSLAHSGRLVADKPDKSHHLEPIFASIRERVDHLTSFLESYARFARLPKPDRQLTEWAELISAPRELYRFELLGELPRKPGFFDLSQLEQVLINLLKNAVEASDGTPEISVRVEGLPDGGARVQVLDRGRGMSEEVIRQALLPFYSTKPAGSGVGLPLCREIIEAHGGSLRIEGRSGGGTVVSFWLPAATPR